MKSRILKYHYDNRYCELDGEECSHCRKCDHLPAQSKGSWLNKLLIVLVILCVIIFIIHPLIVGTYNQALLSKDTSKSTNKDISKDTVKDTSNLEARVDNYNKNMPADERAYRNHVGLGNESYGENYNPMK